MEVHMQTAEPEGSRRHADCIPAPSCCAEEVRSPRIPDRLWRVRGEPLVVLAAAVGCRSDPGGPWASCLSRSRLVGSEACDGIPGESG